MKKNKIRLTESQLQRMIKESVKHALNESHLNEVAETYDYYEHQELIDAVEKRASELRDAISKLANYYFDNVETNAQDMYNSYAGKYSDEAKSLIYRAIDRLGSMLVTIDDDE